jgi:hypothetical protein
VINLSVHLLYRSFVHLLYIHIILFTCCIENLFTHCIEYLGFRSSDELFKHQWSYFISFVHGLYSHLILFTCCIENLFTHGIAMITKSLPYKYFLGQIYVETSRCPYTVGEQSWLSLYSRWTTQTIINNLRQYMKKIRLIGS